MIGLRRLTVISCFAALILNAVDTALAGDAVRPGALVVEPPTLICLGFELPIEGDDNRNASVALFYRKAGAEEWRRGLPLLRLGGERVSFPRSLPRDYVAPEMFAGSLFDLEPDTEYECRLVVADPEGVEGEAARKVTVRTRAEPRAWDGGRALHVYPPGYKGEKQEPAFTGLREAYHGAGGGDWAWVGRPRVQPGDVVLVHAGLYKSERDRYNDPLGLPFEGTYLLTRKGTPERPIVVRSAGDGEVIFDGAGAFRLFDVTTADYHHFEGLTIRNTDVAFYAGVKDVVGCRGLVVRNCRLEDVGIGVTSQYAGSSDFYIADNVMLGRNDPHRLLGWAQPSIYGRSPLKSYYGVKVYGQGHVICHNYVAYFHDGITVCTHGLPDEDWARRAVAIDIYNNDIFLVCDDFIEADGGVHNIRVLRNRGFNAGQCGLSGQPIYGGPAYYIRNILYHVPNGIAFKWFVNPTGLVAYHNTIISEWITSKYSNAHLRNNLFLGRDAPGRPILRTATYTNYTTFDYNGWRPNRDSSTQFAWTAPPAGVQRAYEGLERRDFDTLEAFREGTGQEAHGRVVEYDIFLHVTRPDPDRRHAVYRPEDFDFRLVPRGAAVDAGCPLPNVNDGFTGKAPDLGAYERERPLPVYGPRPATAQLEEDVTGRAKARSNSP